MDYFSPKGTLTVPYILPCKLTVAKKQSIQLSLRR